EMVAAQKVSAAFFDFPNGASLELVSPEKSLGGNPGLTKFLEKRGDALHHLALRVRDIDGLLRRLDARGVPLIDKVSRPGARGHRWRSCIRRHSAGRCSSWSRRTRTPAQRRREVSDERGPSPRRSSARARRASSQ